jgi:hypothetical protein
MQGFPPKSTVAVKMCRNEVSLADIKDFFAEIAVMKRFSKPFHNNVCLAGCRSVSGHAAQVVRLLGVCTRERPLYIIMEYMGMSQSRRGSG